MFIVTDQDGNPIYTAGYAQACHEHINDAINEYDTAPRKLKKDSRIIILATSKVPRTMIEFMIFGRMCRKIMRMFLHPTLLAAWFSPIESPDIYGGGGYK